MAYLVDYEIGSRRYNVIKEYLDLNNNISSKSRYVFDLMFEFILCKSDFTLKPKKESKLFDKIASFINAIKTTEPSETLNLIRVFGKDTTITYEEFVEAIEEIPEILLWSPVKALEKMFDDFYENGYGTTFMEEYLKDGSKSEKLIKAGKQTEFDQPCLLSLMLHSDNINHSVLKYCSGDFNDKFNVTRPSKWVDIMIEFGYDKKMRGIDYEFRNYVTKFANLTKFWDVYKSQNISNSFIGNQFLMFGGSNENNDLFKIYEGNYDLVQEVENPQYNDADACKLICDWNAFNKLSPHKQKCVKAYLTQNINFINNFIQRGAEKIYAKLNKAKNTSNYMGLLNKYIKQKSFYNNSKLNEINTIQQTLNTRMNNAKFNTISDAMEFIVHQYIPLLRNYKKSPLFNNYTNNVMNNSDVLSVIGVADYLTEEEPSVEVKYVDRVIEKPVVKYETKYINRNLTGGNEERPKNSTEKYVDDLVSFQKDFNKRYCEQWRIIVNKLKNIPNETIVNDSNINLSVVSLIRKVLIYSTKTTYYISGLFTTKNLNKQYTAAVENLISTIESDKVSSLNGIIENLKQIVNLCSSSLKRVKELKNRYIIQGSTLIDQYNISNGRLKVENDLTLDEIRNMQDVLTKIERNIVENRSHITKENPNSDMLKNYINQRSDKNKIIDQYFDSIESNLRYQLDAHMNDLEEHDLYLEAQSIIGMRLMINREMKKSYKWLNSVYDVMLSKNRLEQMRNKTLSESVLHKIERAYLDFNSYDKSNEMKELIKKFETYTSDPKKFKSFFKIAKLAKKCIENVNLLGYVERLYKELDIINPEFNWNMFKENMISFLVTNMIRVDIFIPNNAENKDSNYSLVDIPKNHTYDLKKLYGDGTKTNTGTDNYDTFGYFNFIEKGKNLSSDLSIKDKTDNILEEKSKYYLKRKDLLKLTITTTNFDSSSSKIQLQDIFNDEKVKDHSRMNLIEILNIPPKIKFIQYGFSLRQNLTTYYNTITNIPIATIQSIYTPIVQVLNKYMEQRYSQQPPMNNASVTKLMYGGNNKIEAGSIFDIINPTPLNNYDVKPEAVQYYISAYYIIQYYFKIIKDINNTSDTNVLASKIKFFKISPLYQLNDIFNKDSNPLPSGSIKPLINVLNDYWDSIEDPNPKTKTTKVIDSLIAEINASIIYGSPDEINTFNENILSGEVDLYAFNFERLNNTISNTLNATKSYLTTFMPHSLTTLNNIFDKYTNTIKNALPNERLDILENMILRKQTHDFDEYNIFCELCMTPFVLVLNFYLNLLKKVYDIIITGGYASYGAASQKVKDFVKNYITNNSAYIEIDKPKNKPGTLTLFKNNNLLLPQIMVTFYDFILNKGTTFDEKCIPDFLKYILDMFKKDLNQVILLMMNYPGYSDIDISRIKNNILKFYEDKIKDVASKANDIQNIASIKKIVEDFNNCNNLIPSFQVAFEQNILKKQILDPKYPFIPSCIDPESINAYTDIVKDKSFTKFVTVLLAVQHPDYYLPQTYATLLENSPLYGMTCSDLGTSLFTPDMIRNPKKAAKDDENRLNLFENFGTTPITNILLYLSKSETAINKTTTNLMNPYYATNLISVIPNILKILYNCSKLVDDHHHYNPLIKKPRVSTKYGRPITLELDAKLEISVLSQILIKLYNEVLPIANNIQFMDYLNTDATHSFTELINEIKNSDVSFESRKPLNYIEWINPLVNTNYGINYDNYNRFEKYNNVFLKPLHDENFTKHHEEIKKILAKIMSHSLILSTSFVWNDPVKTKEYSLMGGNQMYGSEKNYLEEIIDKIATNPRVLSLAGVYNFDENMIKTLFKALYNKDAAFNKAILNYDFPVRLSSDTSTNQLGSDYIAIKSTGTQVLLPQLTSLLTYLYNNVNNNASYGFKNVHSHVDSILTKTMNMNITSLYNTLKDNENITNISDFKSKSTTLKGSDNYPLLLLALIQTLNITIDYMDVMYKLTPYEINKDSTDKTGIYLRAPTIRRLQKINSSAITDCDMTSNTIVYHGHYGYTSEFSTNITTADRVKILNKLYNTTWADFSTVTPETIYDNNSKVSFSHYMKCYEELETEENSAEKRMFLKYIITMNWNNVTVELLNQEFKKGYDIYYHLFINTIIIASHVLDNNTMFSTSLDNVYYSYTAKGQSGNAVVKNFELYAASLLSMWSSLKIKDSKKQPLTISEFYAKEYITDDNQITPYPKHQISMFRTRLDKSDEYANKLFGDKSGKKLTDLFADKYLELFKSSLTKSNSNLVSLTLFRHTDNINLNDIYNIGAYPCTPTASDFATGGFLLNYGSKVIPTAGSDTIIYKHSLKKCATDLVFNIALPDCGLKLQDDEVASCVVKPNLLRLKSLNELQTNSVFIKDKKINETRAVAMRSSAASNLILRYTGLKVLGSINGNTAIDTNKGVSGTVASASVRELLDRTTSHICDFGGVFNPGFSVSSDLNKIMTIARSLYLYNTNITTQDSNLIECWNVIDQLIENTTFGVGDTSYDSKVIAINNTYSTIIGGTDSKLKSMLQNHLTSISTTASAANSVGVATAGNQITTKHAQFRSMGSLVVTTSLYVSAFPIGNHRRLLKKVDTLFDNDSAALRFYNPSIYMTTFTQDDTDYLCVGVGRRLDIKYDIQNVTLFKILSSMNPNTIFGQDNSGETALGNILTKGNALYNKYPFVSCTSYVLIKDYKTKPVLLQPWNYDGKGNLKVDTIFKSNATGPMFVSKTSNTLNNPWLIKPIAIDKTKTLDINADLSGLVKAIEELSKINIPCDCEKDKCNTEDVVSMLMNCCVFGVPLKENTELLKIFRSIKGATIDDYINSILLQKLTFKPDRSGTFTNNMFGCYMVYNILTGKLSTSQILNLYTINSTLNITDIVNNLNGKDGFLTDDNAKYMTYDPRADNLFNGKDEIKKNMTFFTNYDGFYKNTSLVSHGSKKEDENPEIEKIHMFNLTDIKHIVRDVSHNKIIGNKIAYTTETDIGALANTSTSIMCIYKSHEILQNILKDVQIQLSPKDVKIVYSDPDIYMGIHEVIDDRKFETVIHNKPDIDIISSLLLIENEGYNKTDDISKTFDEFTTSINNVNINMFGGAISSSYNLVADNQSYIEYDLQSLVKTYYYKGDEKRFAYLMPTNCSETNMQNLIVSYYNKSLMLFSPLFNKYLFVEIIYNSNVLKQFIISALDILNKHTSSKNSQTVKYLYNMFKLKDDYHGINIGEKDTGSDGKYNKTWLIENKVDGSETIYNKINMSPTSIGHALIKFREVMEDHEKIKTSESVKYYNNQGLIDVLSEVAGKLMDIDKFNLIIGTLCTFIKSIGFYNPREETFVTYASGKTNDPLSLNNLK